jgi:hypothetical protein
VVPYRERCPVGDHSFDLLSGRCTAKTETESRPFRSQVRLPWRDRTGDNSTDPAWQAEPVDAATPGKPQNLCTNLCHAADVERVGQPFDRMAAAQSAALPPVSQAMDLIALTAKPLTCSSSKLRRSNENSFGSSWRTRPGRVGKLRMSFREPFSQLRLSNRATHTNNGDLGTNSSAFDIWR